MTKLSALLLLCAAAVSPACGGDSPHDGSAVATTTAPQTASQGEPGETGAGEDDTATAAGTVRAWAGALAERDTERAWTLTHTASRDAFGGRRAFDVAAADLAERYGAWAEATDLRYEATPMPAAGSAVTIVVLTGTVAGRSGTAPAVLAVPVRQDAAGTHQVDPFQDLLPEGHLEHHPEPGSTISPRQEFEVYLVGGRTVSLIADDEVLRVTSESADGDRQRVRGRPTDELDAGSQALTVVVARDGAVQARAVRYRV